MLGFFKVLAYFLTYSDLNNPGLQWNNAGRGSTMPVFVMGGLRVSSPTLGARPPQFGHQQDFTSEVKLQKAQGDPQGRGQAGQGGQVTDPKYLGFTGKSLWEVPPAPQPCVLYPMGWWQRKVPAEIKIGALHLRIPGQGEHPPASPASLDPVGECGARGKWHPRDRSLVTLFFIAMTQTLGFARMKITLLF